MIETIRHRVLESLEERFSARILELKHMTFGHSGNPVFKASFDASTLPNVIIKCSHDATRLTGLERNLETLAKLGLPVPRILGTDFSGTAGFVLVILQYIPGTDLRDELPTMTQLQMTRLAEQIVGFQRLVSTLESGQGFGWVPLGRKGTHGNWFEIIERDFEAAVQPLADQMPPSLLAGLRKRLRELEPRIRTVQPTCFLDDLTTKNVIVQNGVLQGLVDFDVVCYGDPLYWLALTRAAVMVDIGAAGAHYVNELERFWGVGDEARSLLEFYTAIHIMSFAVHGQNAELFERCWRWLHDMHAMS
jgi:aminoglycoside phosphotransferase (APT) family kinase protein